MFRVKHIEGIGYWPQVKIERLGYWKRIAKHVTGFGLYSAESIDYPAKTAKEAQGVIDDYVEWEKKKAQEPTYTEYNLS